MVSHSTMENPLPLYLEVALLGCAAQEGEHGAGVAPHQDDLVGMDVLCGLQSKNKEGDHEDNTALIKHTRMASCAPQPVGMKAKLCFQRLTRHAATSVLHMAAHMPQPSLSPQPTWDAMASSMSFSSWIKSFRPSMTCTGLLFVCIC